MVKRKTQSEFLIEAMVIHGSCYNYSLVEYKNYHTKVIIKCNVCNKIFKQRPSHHLGGQGCKNCVDINQTRTLEDFIQLARQIHGNIYDYSDTKYINAKTKLKIKCNICQNTFNQTPNDHLNNETGCRICMFNRKRLTLTKFINKSNIKHNYQYDYTLCNYINNYTKVIIICKKCNNKFSLTPDIHMRGQGCTICKNNNVSALETEWLDSINILFLHRQKTIVIDNKKYKVDAYDLTSNTIYEFNGDYWHGNPKIYATNEINKKTNTTFGELYNKTIRKETILKQAGYNIISIWESDWLQQKKTNDHQR